MQFLGITGFREVAECVRDFSGVILDLVTQSIDHRAEFRILGVFHETEPIRDPDHIAVNFPGLARSLPAG
ncbi:hypothetical protein ACFVZH_06725 [Streptomyces sp. NPDC059534]|uniref:hypothetical protein n=1 Tax=Streptomyces sp. NPDC059534 TaxID=3346859 RepID=UPI003691DB35